MKMTNIQKIRVLDRLHRVTAWQFDGQIYIDAGKGSAASFARLLGSTVMELHGAAEAELDAALMADGAPHGVFGGRECYGRVFLVL